MNIALWIIAGLIAVAFGVGGAVQVKLPKMRYRAIGASQHWVDDFTAGHIKAIGITKMVGAAGLIIPPLLGVAAVLSPIAACGLALVMAGAATTRFRRNEWRYMAGDTAFIVILAFLAWGRFGLAPFSA